MNQLQALQAVDQDRRNLSIPGQPRRALQRLAEFECQQVFLERGGDARIVVRIVVRIVAPAGVRMVRGVMGQ